MCETCDVYGEKRNAYRILDRKTEARNHLEILHVDGGIT
jgi:hypothetical protein